MAAFLNKDQIISASDIPTETVHVSEWGGDVLVRGLTGVERDRFEAIVVQQKGGKTKIDLQNFRARLCAWSIVDPVSNERMFSDLEVSQLGQKSAAALERVFDVARRLSGMSSSDVEEMVGNSKSEESGDSGSNSH